MYVCGSFSIARMIVEALIMKFRLMNVTLQTKVLLAHEQDSITNNIHYYLHLILFAIFVKQLTVPFMAARDIECGPF